MDALAAGQPALEEAPPVVAVMVVRDPGPWFEDALSALAQQDYPALSILVVDAASAEDPTDRVAAAVPSAFVRRLHNDPGYAAAANEVLKVVKGASHLLFVHDDVAPAPDAVRLMLEASYRGNAGIATPKLVEWDHPDRLVALGEAADALGRPVALIEAGELDQGQHDAEHEVLVAPGACLLVRADLFQRLGGFDKTLVLGGEDVDLCWRAAVAGARTLTAPAARVRHRGALTTGTRRSPLGDVRVLGLRHRLRAALVAAPSYRFPVTIVIAAGTAVIEAVVAVALGRREAARTALATFGFNARSFGSLLAARRRLSPLRKGGDPAAVRRLLAKRGRFKAAVREAAADELDERTGAQLLRDSFGGWWVRGLRRQFVVLAAIGFVLLVGSRHLIGGPLPQLGSLSALPEDPMQLLRTHLSGARPAGMGGLGFVPAAFPLLGLASVGLLGGTGLVSLLLVLGTLAAGVLGAARLARPIGNGRATAAATISYAAMPLWPDALAEGRLPGMVAYAVAPWLLLRLFRATGLPPFGADAPPEDGGTRDVGLAEAARRARRRTDVRRPVPALVGAGVGGDSGGMAPLFEPFAPGELEGLDGPPLSGRHHGATSGEALTEVGAQHALDEMGAFDEDVELDDLSRARIHHRGVASRRLDPPPAPVRTRLQQAAGMALILGIATALAPSLLPAAAIAILAMLAAVLVAGEAPGLVRAARTAGLGAIGALILLSPWSTDVLRAGQWSALTGAPGPAADAPRMFDLLRFSTGPFPVGPLPLLLLAAALLPLLTGKSWRTTWAARCWMVALITIATAFVFGRGWLKVTPLDAGVLLPFAAAAIALAIALGAAAFEVDLRGHSFGWRQMVSLGAAGAVALACLPMLVGVHSGRWGAPARSHADVLSWMPDLVAEGPFRVLWLGDPAALPLTGWYLEDGLAFATSRNGPPTAADQWAGVRRGVDEQLAGPVRSARRSDLVDLGHRLAPLGVRYIVVPLRAAPVGAAERPVPADLPAALRSQVDLRQIDTNPTLLVFENAAWAPARSQLPPAAADAARDGGDVARLDLSAAAAVLAPSKPGVLRFRGEVAEGEVLLAEANSSRWQLRVAGQTAERHPAFGVTGFTVASSGQGTLRFRTPLLHRLAVLVQVLLWLLALFILLGGALGRSRRALAAPKAARPVAGPTPPTPPQPSHDERPGVVLLDPVGDGAAPTPTPRRSQTQEAGRDAATGRFQGRLGRRASDAVGGPGRSSGEGVTLIPAGVDAAPTPATDPPGVPGPSPSDDEGARSLEPLESLQAESPEPILGDAAVPLSEVAPDPDAGPGDARGGGGW
jgi:GT2 family glycosyltransferase